MPRAPNLKLNRFIEVSTTLENAIDEGIDLLLKADTNTSDKKLFALITELKFMIMEITSDPVLTTQQKIILATDFKEGVGQLRLQTEAKKLSAHAEDPTRHSDEDLNSFVKRSEILQTKLKNNIEALDPEIPMHQNQIEKFEILLKDVNNSLEKFKQEIVDRQEYAPKF